jgi:hypothetical protein
LTNWFGGCFFIFFETLFVFIHSKFSFKRTVLQVTSTTEDLAGQFPEAPPKVLFVATVRRLLFQLLQVP